MATGGISDIALTRLAAEPTGGIVDIHLTRTPPAPDPPTGGIAGTWITRGYSPPNGTGGWWVCFDGATWTLCRLRVVHQIGTWS